MVRLTNKMPPRLSRREGSAARGLERRDEQVNQQLLPFFDPSRWLFVAFEDPIPVDADQALVQKELDLKHGVVTINEVRSERGLPPVPWGNVTWLPERWVPTDVPRRFAGTGDAPPDPGSDYGGDSARRDPVVDAQ